MRKDHILDGALLEEPPIVAYGEGAVLYDTNGNRYLDACSGSNVVNIGHGVKQVAQAMTAQAEKVAYVHRAYFRSQALLDLAERIARMTPSGLNRTWFASSGSAANESALKLARQYFLGKGQADKYKFVARWQSYHGSTMATLAMTGQLSVWRRAFTPLLVDFPHIVAPYCYRCPFNKTYPECNVACADDLERTIQVHGPETIAAFIAEPICGSSLAGVTPPPEYYPRIREICDRYDVLFIADEVMTGIGRAGANFAIEYWDVIPDMIVFGKGTTGGYHPLFGMTVSDEIVEGLVENSQGMYHHGLTYVNNPLAAAVGVAVLDLIGSMDLVNRSREMGEYLVRRLNELAKEHPTIGEVRGRGLHLGIEFVKDKETKEPFPADIAFANRFKATAENKGVLFFVGRGFIDGVLGDQILLCPPLIITYEEAEEILAAIDGSLGELESELLQ